MFMTLNPEYNINITVTSTGTFTQTAIREPRNIKLIGCLVYVHVFTVCVILSQ